MFQNIENRTLEFDPGEQWVSGLPAEKSVDDAVQAFDFVYGAYDKCVAMIETTLAADTDDQEMNPYDFARIPALRERQLYLKTLVCKLGDVAAPAIVDDFIVSVLGNDLH